MDSFEFRSNLELITIIAGAIMAFTMPFIVMASGGM